NDPNSGRPISETASQFLLPGFAGDTHPFLEIGGVPGIQLNAGVYYPFYHSGYDDLYWMNRFVDPGYHYSAALTEVAVVLLKKLSEQTVLPYKFQEIHEVDALPEKWKRMIGESDL